MKYSGNWKKKVQLNKKNTSVLLIIAIIVAGGLILKVIADRESGERIDF